MSVALYDEHLVHGLWEIAESNRLVFIKHSDFYHLCQNSEELKKFINSKQNQIQSIIKVLEKVSHMQGNSSVHQDSLLYGLYQQILIKLFALYKEDQSQILLEDTKEKYQEILEQQEDEDFVLENHNLQQRRFRRKKAEIELIFQCKYDDCQNSYGSENALNQHIKRKHANMYKHYYESKMMEVSQESQQSSYRQSNNQDTDIIFEED